MTSPSPIRCKTSHHASVVVVGKFGLAIVGPSGSGKTTLAHALVEDAAANGIYARWVSDDRTFFSVASNKVIAACPTELRGLREARHYGIVATPFQDKAVIDCVLQLEPENQIDRMRETNLACELIDSSKTVFLPLFQIAERQTNRSISLIKTLLNEIGH